MCHFIQLISVIMQFTGIDRPGSSFLCFVVSRIDWWDILYVTSISKTKNIVNTKHNVALTVLTFTMAPQMRKPQPKYYVGLPIPGNLP